MTIAYMLVADVNKFVRGVDWDTYRQLTGELESEQSKYDYSQHFLADGLTVDTIVDLSTELGFSSEGPCRSGDGSEDDSYCSFDPAIPDDRYPRDAPIVAAKRVIEAYLRSGGKTYATSDDAINSR